jgi:xyloglucan:xyloglucosyl transferase
VALKLMGFSVLLVVANWVLASEGSNNISFDQNYKVTWGFDHVFSLNQGREIQLSMDISSG